MGPVRPGLQARHRLLRLVDPVVQRERFVDQARLASAGDDEAMVLDEDFLTAMEYAMPPQRVPEWASTAF